VNAKEKQAFCRWWYAKGVCPGCGAPLPAVAGQGDLHYLPGQAIHGPVGTARTTVLGELAPRSMPAKDRRVCPYDADTLAALVHIGAGLIDLRAGRSETHPTSLRAGPVPTLTSFEEAVTPPGVVQRPLRGQKDRPTYDPKGAA
jgi:hypothetical protein